MEQELKDKLHGDSLMERLRHTVREAASEAERIETMRFALEEAEDHQKTRLREHIPDLMAELGIDEVTVEGFKVTLRNDLQISMTSPAAISWLDANGFGGLVKTKVEVSYSREERDKAVEVKQYLESLGAIVELKENVHWQTLKAWGRERVEHGEVLPEEHFNLMAFTEAKLKPVAKKL